MLTLKFKLPREVQDPEAVKTLHQSGKLEPLLNVIEFGSERVSYLFGQPIRLSKYYLPLGLSGTNKSELKI